MCGRYYRERERGGGGGEGAKSPPTSASNPKKAHPEKG